MIKPNFMSIAADAEDRVFVLDHPVLDSYFKSVRYEGPETPEEHPVKFLSRKGAVLQFSLDIAERTEETNQREVFLTLTMPDLVVIPNILSFRTHGRGVVFKMVGGAEIQWVYPTKYCQEEDPYQLNLIELEQDIQDNLCAEISQYFEDKESNR